MRARGIVFTATGLLATQSVSAVVAQHNKVRPWWATM
jgi:hypothetical protein